MNVLKFTENMIETLLSELVAQIYYTSKSPITLLTELWPFQL